MKPFCNLTNTFFLISPNDYSRNLTDEIYGCIKHVGMSYDMVMRLPIQERRSMIRKHNMEQDAIEREYATGTEKNTRTYEGESINTFAMMEQSNTNKRG